MLLHKEKLNTSALPQEQLVLFVLGKELMKLESCTEIEAQETIRQPSLVLLGFVQTVLWSWKVYGWLVSHRLDLILNRGHSLLIFHFIQHKWGKNRIYLAEYKCSQIKCSLYGHVLEVVRWRLKLDFVR